MRYSYDLSQVESDELAEACVEIINNDQGLSALFEYLQVNYEIDNIDFAKELADYLAVMHNQTRLWVLKGYKPDELARRDKEKSVLEYETGMLEEIFRKNRNGFKNHTFLYGKIGKLFLLS